jgi:hypothetical protein
MSKNRVMRIIFGPKWVEEAKGWRKTCNEELQNMYFFHRILCDQIKEDAVGEADSTHGRHGQCVLNFSH